MSVYQVDFFIVPKEGNYTLFEGLNLKSFLNNESEPNEGVFILDDDLFWEGLNYDFDEINNSLSSWLNEGDSWSEELKIFGNNDDNCIKVFIEDDFIASIGFRINFTTDYYNFLIKVIEFCRNNNFLIVDGKFDVLELDYNTLQDNIYNSSKYKSYKNF